ncbi:TonB-dependent receptor [Opitutus sp. ER46]|uniref:TonB-dependent receptor domain-containing protein n=1 Tax=Opitutus sp. ER46 TaxID=2161864 RepID=UPI000D2FA7EA|nr:TonB-dependent receptor [Opitutus sp. ER46]PTX97674.1 hypothetical protein DB354_05160 [Opitutus sp. ER46]
MLPNPFVVLLWSRWGRRVGFALLGWLMLATAFAADTTPRSFDLPAGEATEMLKRYAAQAEREILFPAESMAGIQTQAVHGTFTPRAALDRMLVGTGLVVVEHRRTGALLVHRARRPGTAFSPPTTNTKMRKKPLALLGALLTFALGPQSPALAADGSPTGGLTGRVLDTQRGEYIEKALLTVESTKEQVLSDREGQYRFSSLPAGPVQLRVFYTGLGTQVETVTIVGGQTVEHDILMPAAGAPRRGGTDQVIKMEEVVVSSSKEMEGAAIAINEQRFAPNIVNVVSADEFGTITDGSVGEFMKFLPGIVSDYTGGDARRFSMNGVPADNVPITIGGFDLASSAGAGTRRAVELDQVSINSIARIEVLHSPTPESPGSALAGSVNMVPRSAFERSRPVTTYSVHVMMKDDEKDWHKTPGPRFKATRKVHPGFDFSSIVPVNKRFGFTLSGGYSLQYTAQPSATSKWFGAGYATNGTGLPDTTPDNPYMAEYVIRDSGKETERYSLGGTLDFKLSPFDRISVSLQFASLEESFGTRNQTFLVQQVKDFSPTATHGVAGKGEVRLNNTARIRPGATIMPSLTYRHNGPIWVSEVGLGYSRSRTQYQDVDVGAFNATQARRTGVTVSFDDINYLRPGTITVTDAAGAPVDPFQLSSYALGTSSGTMAKVYDERRTAFANLRRDLDVRGVPVAIKTGVDVRHMARDLQSTNPTFQFVGADGKASTTPVGSDDNASIVRDDLFSQRVPRFGFPRIEWESGEKLWELYQTHPEYFVYNESAAYIAEVQGSKRVEEMVSSAYFRGDVAFFNRRLKLVGGVRAEQTNIKAEGPLNDKTRNYQRDASGHVLYDSTGKPLLIVPTSDALGVAKLTRVHRGTRASKEYLRWFPSLNASYNLRENLILRGAYYTSIGRPNLNQYASGITLPDPDSPPSTSNRFSTENVGIKAWTAQTYKVRLEYYFERVGQVSIGAFRREFDNFFGSTVFPVTPEFLTLYGLDPAVYEGYDVSTKYNLQETVRMTGLEFDYKQALTFLPNWARGVQVFANASAQRVVGTENVASNFSGFIPRYGSWGISLTRPKYNVRVNWNYRGAHRRGQVTGRGLEAGTYEYGSKRLYIDVGAEYYFHKRLGVFLAMRNLGDAPEDSKKYGPNTPKWARFEQREMYGSLWSFGLKGRF